MKFDVVFSNPPYNDGLDLNIIQNLFETANEMVVIHPSTWLMDRKNKYKPFIDFKLFAKSRTKSLEIFNGNPVFNIALPLPILIGHYVKQSKQTVVWYSDSDEKFFVSNDEYDNITKFGSKWLPLVKPFFDKVTCYTDFLSNHVNDKNGDYICEFSWAVGGPVKGLKKDKASLYSMAFQKSFNNFISKEELKPANIQFYFESEEQRLNFLNYCKTDFARFCLVLYKNDRSLNSGALSTVPWLDFNEVWDDEKLFKKFNINRDEQDYIRDFLPDYHGIRK